MEKTISVRVKDAMKVALQGLGATSNGTEVLQVLTSGDDQFDKYPTIRILPQDYNRVVNADARTYEYTMTYIVSIYLELDNQQETPDADVVDTMQELVDKVFDKLDDEAWLENVTLPSGSIFVADGDSPVVIDVTSAKTGVALYADITYAVTYKKSF